MPNLKKLIQNLSQNEFNSLNENLEKNRANNFKLLLNAYRDGGHRDKDIIEELQLNQNAFYVMKSRLFDKIQEQLSGDMHTNREEVIRKLHSLPEIIHRNPREVATAMLHKMEKDLLFYDMHPELVQVYSGLKKIHLHSAKYFHYSQLYNKHVAFGLSVEKAEEVLGEFLRMLGQYRFHPSSSNREALYFMRDEMEQHYKLNQSRHSELIRNLLHLHLALFSHEPGSTDLEAGQLLKRCEELLNGLPPSSPCRIMRTALDFLFMEYYLRSEQLQSAEQYYRQLLGDQENILLFNTYCLIGQFMSSRYKLLNKLGKGELKKAKQQWYMDSDDVFTQIQMALYEAMHFCFEEKYKEMALRINKAINQFGIKEQLLISCELKLTQCFAYILLKDMDSLDSVLRSLSRKIKVEAPEAYRHVLDLIKAFELEAKDEVKQSSRKREYFALFLVRNQGQYRVLDYLEEKLKQRYL